MSKINACEQELQLTVVETAECERTSTVLKKETISRGFGLIRFLDRYGQVCSLQDSSLATEAAIWLGVTNTGDVIEGPVTRESNEDINVGMHLTQSMVKQLLPYLQKFAETGDYIRDIEVSEAENNT